MRAVARPSGQRTKVPRALTHSVAGAVAGIAGKGMPSISDNSEQCWNRRLACSADKVLCFLPSNRGRLCCVIWVCIIFLVIFRIKRVRIVVMFISRDVICISGMQLSYRGMPYISFDI